MFENIKYATASRRDNNIDIIRVLPTMAWVLDGANSLFPTHISDDESDAKWYVKELNQYLCDNLRPTSNLEDILLAARQRIMNRFLQFQKEELLDLEYPNISFAFVSIKDDMLHYCILGPCEIIFRFHDGNVKSVSDLRLPIMDAKLMNICQSGRRKQRAPLHLMRDFMDHMLIENRIHRNTQDGYYVFGEDEMVLQHCISGTVPLNHIQSISLMCHGFEEYYRPQRIQRVLGEYIFEKRNIKLVEGYEAALKRQDNNISLARYMQEQLSKPSTYVSFDVGLESLVNS